MLLGGAAGQAFGGIIGPGFGWQYALLVIAAAGLVPVLAVMFLQEPPRGPCSEVCPIRKLLTVPAYLAMIAGGACITFSSVSILTWGVDFAVTYKDFSLRQASVSLAVIGLVCSLCGVLFGGFVADRLQRRFAFGRIIAIAIAFLLAAPFVLLAIQTAEQWLVLAGLALAACFMSWYHGPVTSLLYRDVVERPLVPFFQPLAQIFRGDKAGFAGGQIAAGALTKVHEGRVRQAQNERFAVDKKFRVDGVRLARGNAIPHVRNATLE